MKDIKLLISLCDWNPPELFNYETLSDFFGLKSSSPRFRKIIKWLNDNKVLSFKTDNEKNPLKLGNSYFLIMKKNILIEQLPEIDSMKYIHEKYIKKYWKQAWVYDK